MRSLCERFALSFSGLLRWRNIGDTEFHAHELDACLFLEQGRQPVHLADGKPLAVEAGLHEQCFECLSRNWYTVHALRGRTGVS